MQEAERCCFGTLQIYILCTPKHGPQAASPGTPNLYRCSTFSDSRLIAASLLVAKFISAAWLTAGACVLQDLAARLPLNVQANIKGGELLLGSLRVPLPISGTGQFSVMYVDPDVRVFSDPQRGTVSVQVKASRLEQLLN